MKALQELISYTQLHLIQEYARDDWLMIDRSRYTYFKQFAAQYRPTKPKPIPKTMTQPAPKPPPKPRAPVPVKPKKEIEKVKKAPPPSPPPELDFSDIRKIMKEHLSHIQILDEIPEMTESQTPLNHDIVIVGNHPLLKNLAKAITTCIKPATVVKTLPESADVKLLISQKDNGNIVLQDNSVYLKHPDQKAALWKKILQISKDMHLSS